MRVKYKIRDQHGLHFFTCTIVGWTDLFTRQIYRDIVLESWRFCSEHKGLQVHAYVFMSNHLHLIASCKPPHRLEGVMRDWKAYTAKQFLGYLQDKSKPESRREWLLYLFSFFAADKKRQQNHQFWQHDNHPIHLYSEEVIAQKMDYIHYNPVKEGLVLLGEYWLYSSAPDYAGSRQEPMFELVPVWKWFYEDGPGAW